MKYTNKNKGITLIALIITIIVMLLLVAVTISLAINGGLFRYAGNAAKETEQAKRIEEEHANIQSNLTTDQLIDKYTYGISAKKIAEAEDKSEYYGAFVKNYHADITGTDYNEGIYGEDQEKWKIFYAGPLGENNTNYIYLISSSFLHYDYLPETTNGNKPERYGSSYYAFRFGPVYNDYSSGTASVLDEVKYLNQQYFNYLDSRNLSYNYDNSKAFAYLLDTNIWSVFKDELGAADFAIGGPSLELFIKSYNDKYNTGYLTKVQSVDGYYISINGGESWTYSSSNAYGVESIKSLFVGDKLYMAYDKIDMTSTFMTTWASSLLHTVYKGKTIYTHLLSFSYNVLGLYPHQADFEAGEIRPVIRLKASTLLEKNDDGSFSIIE